MRKEVAEKRYVFCGVVLRGKHLRKRRRREREERKGKMNSNLHKRTLNQSKHNKG